MVHAHLDITVQKAPSCQFHVIMTHLVLLLMAVRLMTVNLVRKVTIVLLAYLHQFLVLPAIIASSDIQRRLALVALSVTKLLRPAQKHALSACQVLLVIPLAYPITGIILAHPATIVSAGQCTLFHVLQELIGMCCKVDHPQIVSSARRSTFAH